MTPPCVKKPEWFHPARSDYETAEAAIHVCQTCPLMASCLADAVDRDERDGVWGGVCFNAETARSLTAKARRPRNTFMGPPPGSIVGGAKVRAAQTHCKRGHPFDAENTEVRMGRAGRPNRRCRKCKALADRLWSQRRRMAGSVAK